MVPNNRRTKLLFKIIIGQIAVGLLICFVALSAIVYAQGYRFNYKNMRVYRTGIIVVDYLPRDASVYVNGNTSKHKPPFAVNLSPGFYNVSVSKNDFAEWHKNVNVESESVNIFKNVILFRNKIEVSDLLDSQKIDYLNSPLDILARNSSNYLTSNGHEIWVGDKLITRFSDQIQNVVWYSDLAHIVFQQSDEIRIIDITGDNDTLLVKLGQKSPTRFVVNGRGDELYFVENNKYKMAKIR